MSPVSPTFPVSSILPASSASEPILSWAVLVWSTTSSCSTAPAFFTTKVMVPAGTLVRSSEIFMSDSVALTVPPWAGAAAAPAQPAARTAVIARRAASFSLNISGVTLLFALHHRVRPGASEGPFGTKRPGRRPEDVGTPPRPGPSDEDDRVVPGGCRRRDSLRFANDQHRAPGLVEH